MAWLSILGMYNYDESVFDGFRTPDNVDKDTTIQTILLECAELELIYPEFETMKNAITLWTNKEFAIWEELQKTREYEYNPIWNKDGIVTETESSLFNKDRTGRYNGTGSGVNTEYVQGFNENTWAGATKSEGSNNANTTENEESTDTGEIERTRIEQGNIGVTTTQRMIQEQREVVVFNTMEYILSSFKKRFCIMVY